MTPERLLIEFDKKDHFSLKQAHFDQESLLVFKKKKKICPVSLVPHVYNTSNQVPTPFPWDNITLYFSEVCGNHTQI